MHQEQLLVLESPLRHQIREHPTDAQLRRAHFAGAGRRQLLPVLRALAVRLLGKEQKR